MCYSIQFKLVAKEAPAASNNGNKKVIFDTTAPLTSFIIRINNTQIYDAHWVDTVMLMYNLIAYSDNYSKTYWILWQYCKDELALADNGDITGFDEVNADTNSFKLEEKIAGQTGGNSKENVEIMVPLKHLSNFWRTLQMPLINCKINFHLNWSQNSFIVTTNAAAQALIFWITDIKL